MNTYPKAQARTWLVVIALATTVASAQSSSSNTVPDPPTGNQDSSKDKTEKINAQDTQSGNDLSANKKDEGATGDSSPPTTGRIKSQDSQTGNNLFANGRDGKNGAAFDRLDTGRTGSLTRDQAKGDAWLAKNFKKCDADHDGSVSREEFTACRATNNATDGHSR